MTRQSRRSTRATPAASLDWSSQRLSAERRGVRSRGGRSAAGGTVSVRRAVQLSPRSARRRLHLRVDRSSCVRGGHNRARHPRHPPDLPPSGPGSVCRRRTPARREPECTAAITTGWQFTGLLGALQVADLHVADEFSVVSVIAAQFAEMLTPALTGIEWPAFEAGRLAAEMLIERLADDSVTQRQLLIGGELVIRESTGPARSVTPPAKPTD